MNLWTTERFKVTFNNGADSKKSLDTLPLQAWTVQLNGMRPILEFPGHVTNFTTSVSTSRPLGTTVPPINADPDVFGISLIHEILGSSNNLVR